MAITNKYPTIRPSLNLDFANSKTIDPRITFSRASSATYFDEKGVMRTAPSGVPRIDHDPVTGECKGLLIEEQRARLNLISAAPTVGENITVTAVAHTVSFYGTGSIALTGAHTATVLGSGAFPTRTTITFTPTAGTLTITPSGTVQHLQIEAGPFATSVIPGEGSQVTRAADTASMTVANFSDWYRQDEGTLFADFTSVGSLTDNRAVFSASDNTFGNSMYLLAATATAANKSAFNVVNGGVSQATVATTTAYTNYTKRKAGATYKQNSVAVATDGSIGQQDTVAILPAVDRLYIGASWAGSGQLSGHIYRLAYYPKRLTNEQLQALSA